MESLLSVENRLKIQQRREAQNDKYKKQFGGRVEQFEKCRRRGK
jgi:hypothetical protein